MKIWYAVGVDGNFACFFGKKYREKVFRNLENFKFRKTRQTFGEDIYQL